MTFVLVDILDGRPKEHVIGARFPKNHKPPSSDQDLYKMTTDDRARSLVHQFP